MNKPLGSYNFAADKNQQLIAQRGIGFEEIIAALQTDKLLEVIKHHNFLKYPGQQVYIVEVRNYIYVVPFVEKAPREFFLKTIFPSRKLTKQYLHMSNKKHETKK
jgi:hypothetical protein